MSDCQLSQIWQLVALFQLKNQLCVSGCGQVEYAHHLFLNCGTFSSLWSLVVSSALDWLFGHRFSGSSVSFYPIYATGGLKARC